MNLIGYLRTADNLANWEKYESLRDGLTQKLDQAGEEYKATKRLYDQKANAADYAQRMQTAASMRKDIEDTFKALTESNAVLAKLAQKVKQKELADEVRRGAGAFST